MNPGNLAAITTNDNLLSQEKNIIHAIVLVEIFSIFMILFEYMKKCNTYINIKK